MLLLSKLDSIAAVTNSDDKVELCSSKSGNHDAACPDQDIVYVCRVVGNVTTWVVTYSLQNSTIILHNGDMSVPSAHSLGVLVVTLVKNAPNDMESQLVIPYGTQWNGTAIMCSDGIQSHQKKLNHIIAGSY